MLDTKVPRSSAVNSNVTLAIAPANSGIMCLAGRWPFAASLKSGEGFVIWHDSCDISLLNYLHTPAREKKQPLLPHRGKLRSVECING